MPAHWQDILSNNLIAQSLLSSNIPHTIRPPTQQQRPPVITNMMKILRLLLVLIAFWGLAMGIISRRPEPPLILPAEPPGNATLSMLANLMHQQLKPPGGWLPNDSSIGPGKWLDNATHEQLGMLSVMRPLLKALRDYATRPHPQAPINREIDLAYSSWSVDPQRWSNPSAERLYARGIDSINRYRSSLENNQVNFLITSQSLQASLTALAQILNTHAQSLAPTSLAKLPSQQIDDRFYQTRGAIRTAHLLIKTLNADFQILLNQPHNANVQQLLQQTEQLLQDADFKPLIITKGQGPSLTANHNQRIRVPLINAIQTLEQIPSSLAQASSSSP